MAPRRNRHAKEQGTTSDAPPTVGTAAATTTAEEEAAIIVDHHHHAAAATAVILPTVVELTTTTDDASAADTTSSTAAAAPDVITCTLSVEPAAQAAPLDGDDEHTLEQPHPRDGGDDDLPSTVRDDDSSSHEAGGGLDSSLPPSVSTSHPVTPPRHPRHAADADAAEEEEEDRASKVPLSLPPPAGPAKTSDACVEALRARVVTLLTQHACEGFLLLRAVVGAIVVTALVAVLAFRAAFFAKAARPQAGWSLRWIGAAAKHVETHAIEWTTVAAPTVKKVTISAHTHVRSTVAKSGLISESKLRVADAVETALLQFVDDVREEFTRARRDERLD